MKHKSGIAPRCTEDSPQIHFHSDFSQCTPNTFCLIISLATIQKFFLSKLDVTSAFLQTLLAECDFYVRPPTETDHRKQFLFLLNASAYGLVNSNSKW